MLAAMLQKSILIIRLSSRLILLVALFLPVLILLPIWVLQERHRIRNNLPSKSTWWPHYLTWSFEMAGPAFTKLGQWASSRSDLFPSVVIAVLSKLQENVRSHSFRQTELIIQDQYGLSIQDLFASFDKTPIGTGAIAQVYRAKLKASGHDVAVKVLHPGVDTAIEIDLWIMLTVANVINLLPGAEWLSLPEEIQVFSQMMKNQLDLKIEAQHLSKFNEHFEKENGVKFPSPLIYLSRRQVLVESFENGIPIIRFLQQSTPFNNDLGKLGMQFFLVSSTLILDRKCLFWITLSMQICTQEIYIFNSTRKTRN